MSAPDPRADVDLDDPAAVAAVLDRVVRTMGTGGLVDLLSQLPGVRVEGPVPRRFLSPAVPGSVLLGAEHRLVLAEPLAYVQVVGGIVLHREALTPASVGPRLAALVVTLAREQGSAAEVRTVLTGFRDATDRF